MSPGICRGEKQGTRILTCPQKRHPDTRPKQRSVSGAVLFLLVTVLIGTLTVGNAFVLDAVIGQFRLTWLAGMLCFDIAVIVVALILWPGLRPVVRWQWLEIVGMIVVGGAFLAHAIHLAPADLMPVSSSVDCSHQHLLVNYIYQHNCFPDGVDYLYLYDDYPVGPSALAAILAHLVGVLPAQTMYPLAALFVTTQVMLAYGTSIELLPRHSPNYILATLATLMIFLAYPYSVHVFAERFYSNMMMGDLMVLLALWVMAVRERLHPVLIAGVAIHLIFGCLNSYPAWLPFVAAPLFISTLLDQRMSVLKRWALVSIMLIVTLVLTGITIADQWDFITWFAPSRARQLTPDWQSLGGVFLILVGWGIWTLIRTWKQDFGLTLFLVIDAAGVAALYGIAIADKLTLYIPDKTFYFNVFLFTVLVALGLDRAWKKLTSMRKPKDWVSFAMMIVLALAVVVGVNFQFSRPTVYPITLDEYRVAYQVAHETPGAELTYLVRTKTTFYWMYGGILNHTHDLTIQSEQWQDNVPTYERWIQDATAPSQAIVSDLAMLPQDGRWRIIIRSGNSGVIENVR